MKIKKSSVQHERNIIRVAGRDRVLAECDNVNNCIT